MNHNDHEIYNSQKNISRYAEDFRNASGAIPYGMTNDYMFRAVLQASNKTLRGLICSLLHLAEEEVYSVTIVNPVIPGESAEKKEIRLDINVVLNDHTLFQECPEFYASYKLINVKNHNIYSDNFILNVIDLTRIDLASEDDKKYHIDRWAALLKATTWEEIKMLVSDNEYLCEAAETVYRMNADAQIRKQCRDREEYYQDLRSYERAVGERDSAIESYKREVERQDNAIEGYKEEVMKRDSAIEGYKKTVEEKDIMIRQLLAENAKLKGGR